MKIFYNSKFAKAILPEGFGSIMLFGMLFTKKESLSPEQKTHELIHVFQFIETLLAGAFIWVILGVSFSWWWLLCFPFTYYLLYVSEWIIRTLLYILRLDFKSVRENKAYRNLMFEREAYQNQYYLPYLLSRNPFRFFKYFR